MAEAWQSFKIGDVVTRMGDDRLKIISINWAGDLIGTVCVRGTDLIPIGHQEDFVAWRCSYPDDLVVEHQVVLPGEPS